MTADHATPSPATLPPVMTVGEVSRLMGCQPSTVEDEIRQRLLPAVKMGHSWRIPREPLLAELNRRAAAHVAGAMPAGTSAPRRAALRAVPPPAVPSKRRHSPAPLADPPATGTTAVTGKQRHE